jgi:hypothetical protein
MVGRPPGSKNKPKPEGVAVSSKDIKKLSKEEKASIKAAEKLAKMKNMKYEYTPLAETALGATSLYNLYGVVIDA